MEVISLTFAAFVAGFVDAIAGGGGVITFPALLLFGLPVSQIVSTNKLVSTAGTTIAAATFARRGLCSGKVLKASIPFSAVGSLAGAAMITILANEFLRPFVSILVVTIAIICFFRPAIGSNNAFNDLNTRSALLLRFASFGIGFYDGFFGPGTGIFLTFYFVGVLGFDFLRATAHTKILNWVSNLVPLLFFISQGDVRYDLGVPMLCANVLGGYFGATTAIARGSSFIRWIYLFMALITTSKLLYDLWK